MRAFHAGIVTDDETGELVFFNEGCNPFRMDMDLYKRLDDSCDPFECPNCKARIHQCFACKKEGYSDPKGAMMHGLQRVFR